MAAHVQGIRDFTISLKSNQVLLCSCTSISKITCLTLCCSPALFKGILESGELMECCT